MLNSYAELMVNTLENGPMVLFRGANYKRCLSERSNKALRTYQGHKVYIVERRSTRCQPLGWRVKIEGVQHV